MHVIQPMNIILLNPWKLAIFKGKIFKVANLYIIAGCNGAGKTTASYTILPEKENKKIVHQSEIYEILKDLAYGKD
jgi:Fe-S cluster assembly ATPase SufC